MLVVIVILLLSLKVVMRLFWTQSSPQKDSLDLADPFVGHGFFTILCHGDGWDSGEAYGPPLRITF